MKYKRGITVSALVIYVILLFAFTTVALTVSGNLTSGVYQDKGLAVNLSNIDKLQYYLNKSAISSQSAEYTSNSIIFSNGDEYSFDANTHTVYYNGGILSTGVTNFVLTNNITNLYEIELEFTKYSNVIRRTIKVSVGV